MRALVKGVDFVCIHTDGCSPFTQAVWGEIKTTDHNTKVKILLELIFPTDIY